VINDYLPESAERLCAIVRCQRGDRTACAAAADCQQAGAAARMRPVLASFGVAMGNVAGDRD